MKIKFRGKVSGHDTFAESGDLANFFYGVEDGNVSDVAVFTGVLDKNGKEIYEGDKIKVSLSSESDDKEIYTGLVTYHDSGGSFWFHSDPYIRYGLEHSSCSFPLLQCSKNELELIQ
jgi:YopX protein